jgi:hypothetical protein
MGDERKMTKVKLNVSIGLLNTRTRIIEIDAEEWADMDDVERDEFMEEELGKIVQWNYEELKD